jgi:hypothetical protein
MCILTYCIQDVVLFTTRYEFPLRKCKAKLKQVKFSSTAQAPLHQMSLLPDLQFRSNIRQKAAGVQIKLLYHKREFSTTYTKLYPLTEQTYISLTDIMMQQCYPSRARSLMPQSLRGEHCWVRFHFSRWGIRSLLENSTVQSRGNRPCFRGAYYLTHLLTHSSPWWRQYAPPKCQFASTRLNGAISHKTVNFENTVICLLFHATTNILQCEGGGVQDLLKTHFILETFCNYPEFDSTNVMSQVIVEQCHSGK